MRCPLTARAPSPRHSFGFGETPMSTLAVGNISSKTGPQRIRIRLRDGRQRSTIRHPIADIDVSQGMATGADQALHMTANGIS